MSLVQGTRTRRITTSFCWASTSSLSRTRLPAVLLSLPLSSSSPPSSSSSPSPSRSTSFHSNPRSFFHSSPRSFEEQLPPSKTPVGQIQRRLQITFTCTAPVPLSQVQAQAQAEPPTLVLGAETTQFAICSHRSSHQFSRQAYEKGLVLIECPACKNRHLIADHLEWFSTTPSVAHPDGLGFNSDSGTKRSRTIEDLMREKGEQVKWLKGGPQGDTWTVEG